MFSKVGCTIFQSYQPCIRVPIYPHPQQYLLLYDFLIIAILVDLKLFLIMALICIYLIINGVGHVLIGHFYIFLENYLFRSVAHF